MVYLDTLVTIVEYYQEFDLLLFIYKFKMTDFKNLVVEQVKIYQKIKGTFAAYENSKGTSHTLGLIESRMILLDKHYQQYLKGNAKLPTADDNFKKEQALYFNALCYHVDNVEDLHTNERGKFLDIKINIINPPLQSN